MLYIGAGAVVALLPFKIHPNWKAKVDGVSTTTTMLMPGFTGIYLSPGIQEIVVEYRTQYFRKILLGFGVFVLLVIGICERQKRSIPIDILPKRFARLMKFSKTRQSSRANRRRARRRNRWWDTVFSQTPSDYRWKYCLEPKVAESLWVSSSTYSESTDVHHKIQTIVIEYRLRFHPGGWVGCAA